MSREEIKEMKKKCENYRGSKRRRGNRGGRGGLLNHGNASKE